MPQLYLTWHAPFGMPGASAALEAACDDIARVDTLFLSFDPGVPGWDVVSMGGVLYFHPEPGDSLRDFWYFKRGSANESGLLVDFANPGFPCDSPWEGPGRSALYYDRRAGRGRLDLFFWNRGKLRTSLVPSNVYCFARVKINHRRADLEGCTQPVALEWASAYITYRSHKEVQIRRGQHRFATWNVPPARRWTPDTGFPLVRAWQPRYEVPPIWVAR